MKWIICEYVFVEILKAYHPPPEGGMIAKMNQEVLTFF